MIVFGFSHLEPYAEYYHDTNIAILQDNQVLLAALEERYSRLKHHAGFPGLALNSVRSRHGLTLPDADIIAIAENRSPGERRVTNASGVALPTDRLDALTGVSGDLFFCDHQLAHASVAYRLSPFDEAVVVTLDGMGHDLGAPCFGAVFQARGNSLVRKRTCWSDGNSLGLTYGFVTEALGWRMSDGEGKTMGLAAYGDPEPAEQAISELMPVVRNGDLIGGRRFGPRSLVVNHRHVIWDPIIDELSMLAKSVGRENLAAAAQAVLEDRVINWIASLLEDFPGTRNLCLGGGIFLNVAVNSRVRAAFPEIDLYVPPSPADGGIALGAALEAAAQNGAAKPEVRQCQFFGQDYPVDLDRLTRSGLSVEMPEDPSNALAAALANGEVVGLYQGRSEWGPRALGNRSVLAHPGLPGLRDRINRTLKRREPFMPFAPAIKRAKMSDWFEGADRPSPYMMFTQSAKPEVAERISNVLHIDQTGRIQTVSEADNALLSSTLDEFERRTDMPLLLNTSFNLHGMPLVETVSDALEHLQWGCVDSLFLGGILLRRRGAATVN